MFHFICYWLIAALIVVSDVCVAEDAQEVLAKVKQKYDSMRDVELRFLQRTTSPISAGRQSVTGTLFIKKQNKFRVELEGQLIITDGETIWSYNSAHRQVVIDKFKKNDRTLTPESILGAAPTDYNASLRGSEKVGRIQTRILKLVPKDESSLVTSMMLWVDDAWLIRKAEVSDVNGRLTTYFVNDIKVNPNIPDARFTYQVPKGVEAVDLR